MAADGTLQKSGVDFSGEYEKFPLVLPDIPLSNNGGIPPRFIPMPQTPQPSPASDPEFVSELTGHQEVLHSFLISLLPGVADVDDILQRANLVLWEKRVPFASGTSFKSWALSVAYWEARAWMSERKRGDWLVVDDELARQIIRRIEDLFDGKLAPNERAALLAEIGRDPELLDIYWDDAVLEGAFARLSRSGMLLRADQAAITESALRGRGKRHLRWSLMAAAAVLALVAVALHLVSVRNAPPTVTLRLSPGSVFQVSHAMAEKESLPGPLLPGSRARLDQGTVELTFASGVRSIVRGPAELSLYDAGNLFVRSGTAWFHVPAKAAGFKVQTPEMTVTDLGTEFGVRSRNGLAPEVHVFKGRVEVRTHGPVSVTETLGDGTARSVGILGHLGAIQVALFPVNWCGDQRSANSDLPLDELYIFEAALSETQVRNL